MAVDARASPAPSRSPHFALAKFRPPMLPPTLVTRAALRDQLTAGAGQRLTLVVGPAGTGKTVLLSDWAATRFPHATAWLSCDEADADPFRFWTAFIEAIRTVTPGFGTEAAGLLARDRAMTANITASIANDAADLPIGSALVVDDYQYASARAAGHMLDLVQRWPAERTQLVISSRFDPPLRLHRLRVAGNLRELRNSDLCFSLADSGDLLARFGVELPAADLTLLHHRSEGWAAALQMAALSLRATTDPAQVARALDIRSHTVAEYFISEVLDQQPPEIARFMLDSSVLSELTVDGCAAVTGRPEAAGLLHHVDAADLFLVALDDERASFRYHQLVHQVLRAELRRRDPAHAQVLQLRAAEWFESVGNPRRAARHFLAAQQVERALDLLEHQVVTDYLHDAVLPSPLDLSLVNPSLIAQAPDRLLAVAADLLISGETTRGGECLDMIERLGPSIPPESRLAARYAAMRAFLSALTGKADEALAEGLAARAIQERAELTDDWSAALPLILMHVYTWLEDLEAVESEAAVALATPMVSEPVKLVHVAGARALAWFEAGHLTKATQEANAANADASRLGFQQHFFALEYLLTLAGLSLEQRDVDAAERFTEHTLAIAECGRLPFKFLALLNSARIQAAREHVHDALETVETARTLLTGTDSVLLARADEMEALLRLSLGDVQSPIDLASGLAPTHRHLLEARIALATGDHKTAVSHLQESSLDELTPRLALVRQLLLSAAAIARADPTTGAFLGVALEAARRGGFVDTVVTTAPQVTSYLVEHSTEMRSGPFMERLITAALDVRATQPATSRRGPVFVERLTAAETRILKLLPTSTYQQIGATLCISRSTVKTHLRSVYHKLGVNSRPEAVERAVDLRLL